MSVYAGLDGGSTYLKAALIDQSGRVLRTGVKSTGIDNNGGAKVLLQQLCREAGVPAPDYTMATGYSRKILEVADDDVSEITAHAYGVRITAPQSYRPGLIVDIGGQDSKVIYLDDQYRVKNFSMNDKCAAGTGKFMEVIAQILETTIDQVGPISLESTAPCDINSTCVVFAQSEVISLVARKFDRRDILAGMHADRRRSHEHRPAPRLRGRAHAGRVRRRASPVQRRHRRGADCQRETGIGTKTKPEETAL